MKCYFYNRYNLKITSDKDPTINETYVALVLKIEQIWSKASISVVSSKRILEMINNYQAKYRNLSRFKNIKGLDKFDNNISKFRDDTKHSLIFLPVNE